MPVAPAVKVLLSLTPIVAAAGAALWTNPDFRAWFEQKSDEFKDWFYENIAAPQDAQRRRQRAAYAWEGAATPWAAAATVQGLRDELQEWFQHSVSSPREQERRTTERRQAGREARDMTAARPAAAPERTSLGRGHANGREDGVPDPAIVERATARGDAAKAELRKRVGRSAADETSSLSKDETGSISTTGSQPAIFTRPNMDDSGVLATLDPMIDPDIASDPKAAATHSDSSATHTQADSGSPIDEVRFAELLFAQPGVNADAAHEDPTADRSLEMHMRHQQAEDDTLTSFSSTSSETGEFIATPEASDDEFDVRSATDSLTPSGGRDEDDDVRSVLFSEDVWSETGSQASGTSRT